MAARTSLTREWPNLTREQQARRASSMTGDLRSKPDARVVKIAPVRTGEMLTVNRILKLL